MRPISSRPRPDLVLIANALTRGNPAVEHVLNEQIPYTSGPRWLGENYLNQAPRSLGGPSPAPMARTPPQPCWPGVSNLPGCSAGFSDRRHSEQFRMPARTGAGLVRWSEAEEYDTAFFEQDGPGSFITDLKSPY